MSLSLNKPRLDNLAGDIRKSAERLRGKFKAYEYQSVILPIIVIRRLECVLLAWRAAKRAEVLAKRPKLTAKELDKLVKGALVESLPTRYAFGGTEFHVLRPSGGVDGKFLYYATLSPIFRAYAAENMTWAAGQKRVSSRFLKDTRLFLPTLPEQRLIAAFPDKSCAVIDGVASLDKRPDYTPRPSKVLNQQMDTLLAYRKSVIHECVTGQRRVTEEDLRRAGGSQRACPVEQAP